MSSKQIREMVGSDLSLTRDGKRIVLAAFDGEAALRARLAEYFGDGVRDSDEGFRTPEWAHSAAAAQFTGTEPSPLGDALRRLSDVSSLAVAEKAVAVVLAEAKVARRRAIEAQNQARDTLARTDDRRVEAARALLSQAGPVLPEQLEELVASWDRAQLRRIAAINAPDPEQLRAHLERIAMAYEAVMTAGEAAIGSMNAHNSMLSSQLLDRDLDAEWQRRSENYAAIDDRKLQAFHDRRAHLARLRRELFAMVHAYPDVTFVAGIDGEVIGRYIVARSAARALAIETRSVEAMEARLVELADSLAELRLAARAELTWASVADRLPGWLDYARNVKIATELVCVLAEADARLARYRAIGV
jgi:hypothetical protein